MLATPGRSRRWPLRGQRAALRVYDPRRIRLPRPFPSAGSLPHARHPRHRVPPPCVHHLGPDDPQRPQASTRRSSPRSTSGFIGYDVLVAPASAAGDQLRHRNGHSSGGGGRASHGSQLGKWSLRANEFVSMLTDSRSATTLARHQGASPIRTELPDHENVATTSVARVRLHDDRAPVVAWSTSRRARSASNFVFSRSRRRLLLLLSVERGVVPESEADTVVRYGSAVAKIPGPPDGGFFLGQA